MMAWYSSHHRLVPPVHPEVCSDEFPDCIGEGVGLESSLEMFLVLTWTYLSLECLVFVLPFCFLFKCTKI